VEGFSQDSEKVGREWDEVYALVGNSSREDKG
jgi:hypothetical protein